MLDNFCFHVYAQKCQVVKLSCCQVVKYDPWNMLNNFCFHVYAQKCQVVCMGSIESPLTTSCMGSIESPLTSSCMGSSERPLTTSCMGSSESTRHGSSQGKIIMWTIGGGCQVQSSSSTPSQIYTSLFSVCFNKWTLLSTHSI